MNLFLLVEGPSDRDALTLLVNKIRSVTVGCKPVRGAGDFRNSRKMAAHIKEELRKNKDISKILICIDSECTDPEETKKSFLHIETDLRKSFPLQQPTYIVVDHSLEGWLACDKQALKKVLGQGAHIPSSNPENNCHPNQLLDRIFTTSGRHGYEKGRDAWQLAEACDPKNIASRSGTFRIFQQAVLDP